MIVVVLWVASEQLYRQGLQNLLKHPANCIVSMIWKTAMIGDVRYKDAITAALVADDMRPVISQSLSDCPTSAFSMKSSQITKNVYLLTKGTIYPQIGRGRHYEISPNAFHLKCIFNDGCDAPGCPEQLYNWKHRDILDHSTTFIVFKI